MSVFLLSKDERFLMNDSSDEQQRLKGLEDRMRKEWDDRIRHDYRYWMSDGVASDRDMWQAGERDFEILFQDLSREDMARGVALELGCGVGRLLKPASSAFARVVGLDVSEVALEKARQFLGNTANIDFIHGSGSDFGDVSDKSIDYAYTFASLSSMPVCVIAQYLLEFARVMKQGGTLRLQMYLGTLQETAEEDTLACRSFPQESFVAALACAGFEVEWVRELKLPFEVSMPEQGLIASILSFRRNDKVLCSVSEVVRALTPDGEYQAGSQWQGSHTEYLMALARAKQHFELSNTPAARDALEFAITRYGEVEDEIQALFKELREEASSQLVTLPTLQNKLGDWFSSTIYEANLKVLQERFPTIAAQITSVSLGDELKVTPSSQGEPGIVYRDIRVSHPDKPKRSAEQWASRTYTSLRDSSKQRVIVFGFADAYHLKALSEYQDITIEVVETNLEMLKAALGVFDLRQLLNRIDVLNTSVEEFAESAADFSSTILVAYPHSQRLARSEYDEVKRIFHRSQNTKTLTPTFGVVSPICGGSLPIARYVARALVGMNHRTLYYDLSPFAEGYSKINQYLRSGGRQNNVTTQYIEMLSQLVLEGIDEGNIDILICLAQAPLSPRVLMEARAKGVITVMWFVEDCRRFTAWQEISKYFDYMFIIQDGQTLEQVEQAGAGRALYLPLACDPELHAPAELSSEDRMRFGSPLSFIGAGYNNRRHMFARLANRPFKIWGTEWPTMAPFDQLVQEGGRRVSVEDYVKIFNASTINLNLHSSIERDGVEPFGDFVNPRTFELASTGAFQLVDTRRLLPAVFEPGKEVITFSHEKELYQKIDFYLHNSEARARVVDAARSRAHRDHTYTRRVVTMLDYIYADRYDQLVSRQAQNPWPETLKKAKPFSELHQRLETVKSRGEQPQLDNLVRDIRTGNGSLSRTEQTLLFLHHIKSQIAHVEGLRKRKG